MIIAEIVAGYCRYTCILGSVTLDYHRNTRLDQKRLVFPLTRIQISVRKFFLKIDTFSYKIQLSDISNFAISRHVSPHAQSQILSNYIFRKYSIFPNPVARRCFKCICSELNGYKIRISGSVIDLGRHLEFLKMLNYHTYPLEC